MTIDAEVSDSAARRAARRVGLVAHKSRWRKYSIDNHGKFMLVGPATHFRVAGSRYDMTPAEFAAYCRSGLASRCRRRLPVRIRNVSQDHRQLDCTRYGKMNPRRGRG